MSTYRIRLVCEQDPEPITGELLEREEEILEVEASAPLGGLPEGDGADDHQPARSPSPRV